MAEKVRLLGLRYTVVGDRSDGTREYSVIVLRRDLDTLELLQFKRDHTGVSQLEPFMGRVYGLSIYCQLEHDVYTFLEEMERAVTAIKEEIIILGLDTKSVSHFWHSQTLGAIEDQFWAPCCGI